MSRWSDATSSLGSFGRVLLTEPRRPVAVRESPRAYWYVVGTVCIGAFMGQLDASIVTLALPRLGRDLHASVGAVEWVALAYLLVLVATVATVGRIADAVGRKLLYVYGFGVFTAGSVLCGLAPTLAVLIAARVLQAVGAAMLQANSVALITEAMPRPLLGRGIGVQGTAQALGSGARTGGRGSAAGARRVAADLPREPSRRSDRARARLVSVAAQPLSPRRRRRRSARCCAAGPRGRGTAGVPLARQPRRLRRSRAARGARCGIAGRGRVRAPRASRRGAR